MYSHYNSKTTMIALVGVTPNRVGIFVNVLYAGWQQIWQTLFRNMVCWNALKLETCWWQIKDLTVANCYPVEWFSTSHLSCILGSSQNWKYNCSLRPYVIWTYALPHWLLFLELHISRPDCKPTNIKAKTNVYDHKWSERRSFYRVYLHCTTSSH